MLPPDDDTPIDALDEMYEDAALAAADDPAQISDADRAWADGVRRRMQARIAEHRLRTRPARRPPSVAPPIRPGFLAMTRDQLLATLDDIASQMGGSLQIAYRNLSDLTDNDLRRLLETLADPE